MAKRGSSIFSTVNFLSGSFLNLRLFAKQGSFLQGCETDILTHLFTFLDAYELRCAILVCKHWKQSAEDESLWYTILKRDGCLNEDEISNLCPSVPSTSSKNSQESTESMNSAISSALTRGRYYYRKKCLSLLNKDSPEYQRANKKEVKPFWSKVFERKKTTLVIRKNRGNLPTHLAATQQKFMTGAAVNYKQAVALPTGEDINEWIAVNTIDFFNQISVLYGTITEYCTTTICPIMNAGPRFEYLWADGVGVKKPVRVSALQYVRYLFEWAEQQFNDETLFPTTNTYPTTFKETAKKLLKRFFRVYAHIYHSHYKEIVDLGEESSLNCSCKHFIYFVREYELMSVKELEPLQDLITSWEDDEKKNETETK